MLLLKLIQSLIKALHSEGTPGQVAAGLVLGSILGLTPLTNLHNAIVIGLIVILNVSIPGAMLGWALCIPVGFLLDPLFDAIGRGLLGAEALRPLWTATRYRATVAERVKRSALYRAVTASKLYSLYRLFRPEP